MKLNYLLVIALLGLAPFTLTMEKPKPIILKPKTTPAPAQAKETAAPQLSKQIVDAELLWKEFKKRIALMRELKEKTQEKTARRLLPPAPTFKSQSEIHLIYLLGGGKTLDEYITLAMNYRSHLGFDRHMDPYLELLKPQEAQFHKLAKQILEAERKYWEYYVFYHGQLAGLTLIHDIMKEMYGWLNIETSDQQSQFFRFFTQQQKEYSNIDEVLKISESLNEKGIASYFDRTPFLIKNLLSATFALFGNAGIGAESAWMYFVRGVSAAGAPEVKEELGSFFKTFGFNQKYIDQIIAIHKNYLEESKIRGNLCQLFIHPSIVDEISYLSRLGGTPIDEFGAIGYYSAETWTPQTKKQLEQLNQKIFDTKLQRPSVSKFLNLWRTDPKQLLLFAEPKATRTYYLTELMNETQARIYLKYSVLMDPDKVKIITYKTPAQNPGLAKKSEEEYKKQLKSIVEEIFKDWLLSGQAKPGEKSRVEKLFELLKQR